jgi:UDP-N-acetyl-D-galactosamine dehydrogenase
MGAYVVSQLVKAMIKRRIHVEGARILIMGLTFKENCPDLRNTRIVDIVRELMDYKVAIDIYDPWADDAEARHEYDLSLTKNPQLGSYDAIVAAVAHDEFRKLGAAGIRAYGKPEHVLYDLKYILQPGESDLRL